MASTRMKDAIEKALPGILPPAELQPISESRQFNHIFRPVASAGIRKAAPDAVTCSEHMRLNWDFLLCLDDLTALGAMAALGFSGMTAGSLNRQIHNDRMYMRSGCWSRRCGRSGRRSISSGLVRNDFSLRRRSTARVVSCIPACSRFADLGTIITGSLLRR